MNVRKGTSRIVGLGMWGAVGVLAAAGRIMLGPDVNRRAPIISAFACPFVALLGTYVLVRWVVEGFRTTGQAGRE